jgi:mlo protein
LDDKQQMGSKYKAALIPRRIRDTIHGWGKATRKKRRRRRHGGDDSTVRTETSTVCSLTDEEDDDDIREDTPRASRPYLKMELQPQSGEGSTTLAMLLRQASVPMPEPSSPSNRRGRVTRSASMPGIASLRTTGTPTRVNGESARI